MSAVFAGVYRFCRLSTENNGVNREMASYSSVKTGEEVSDSLRPHGEWDLGFTQILTTASRCHLCGRRVAPSYHEPCFCGIWIFSIVLIIRLLDSSGGFGGLISLRTSPWGALCSGKVLFSSEFPLLWPFACPDAGGRSAIQEPRAAQGRRA